MEVVRLFCVAVYSFENDQVAALEAMQSKFGRYDYFSGEIAAESSEQLPGRADTRFRVVSFSKLAGVTGFARFAARVRKLENRLVNKQNRLVRLIPGYLNDWQVVAGFGEFEADRIAGAPELFLKLELQFDKMQYQVIPATSAEFAEKAARAFFADLRRLYLDQLQSD